MEIWCADCGILCENISPLVAECPECEVRWITCPDCGETYDVDENWNHEQGLCDYCADYSNGIEILPFNNPEELFKRIEEIFGDT